MNTLPQLPDFLTLWSKDSVRGTTNFNWNIPDSYYSNDRSSTCYLSCVSIGGDFDAMLAVAPAQDTFFIILKDGGPNYSTTANNGIVLGQIQGNTTRMFNHFPTVPIQALIKSNPQTFNMVIVDSAGVEQKTLNTFSWVITLRFEYINAVTQAAGLESTFQPNLLKQI
mgnify:CR=1 FL=1